MRRVALDFDDKPKYTHVPKGTVLVAIKRFQGTDCALVGPYSRVPYDTPVGEWSREYKSVKRCVRGWHITTPAWASQYRGEIVYIVEVRGRISCERYSPTKAVVGQIRIMRKVEGLNVSWSYNNEHGREVMANAVKSYIRSANAKDRRATTKRAGRKAAHRG